MKFRDSSRSAVIVIVANLLFACSNDDGNSSGVGGAAGSGGNDPGVGGAAKGGSGGSTASGGTTTKGGSAGSAVGGSSGATGSRKPLLEQPQELAFDCSVPKPVATTTSPKVTTGAFGPQGSNGPMLALVSQELLDGSGTLATGLYISSLTSSDEIRTPVSIRPGWVNSPTMISQGNGATLVWGETDSTDVSSLWSAQLDGSGAIQRAAAKIHSWTNRVNMGSFELASNGTEVRLFVATSDPETGAASIESAPLAADGTLAKGLSPLLHNETNMFLYDAVGFDGGFAIGYGYYDGSMPIGRYVAYDKDLVPRHEAVSLNMGSSGFWGNRMNLMARGDRMLIANVNGTGSFDEQPIATYIELSTIDASGKFVGSTERLQAPVGDVENLSPLLVPVGTDLGLLWSKGSVIYICAGCTPDNALNFVVLDGATLRPKSTVLSIPSPDERGGLTKGELAGKDGNFALLTSVQYHVTSAMALGRISCTAK
jgi:hypothetical protein